MKFYWLDDFTLPSVRGFKPHLLHHFLTFYVDLTKWPDGLMSRPGQQTGVLCPGQSCGPRASCRAAVWPSICEGVVCDVEVGCAEGADPCFYCIMSHHITFCSMIPLRQKGKSIPKFNSFKSAIPIMIFLPSWRK
jgi:hypothetical protein